jgi:hypothetical protein
MFAKSLAILLCFTPLIAYGQNRAPFGPPGYELPDRLTPENLDELGTKIWKSGCKSPGCIALRIAIGEIMTDTSQRKNPGTIWEGRPVPDIPYGAIKAREIDDSLKDVKAIWPDICRAVVEIGARDDFVHGYETYGWLAASVLDMARHLTRPGLDCLGQALAAMPASKYLQASMGGAWQYCLDERRGAARCERLKPIDPDFLPAPPLHSVP